MGGDPGFSQKPSQSKTGLIANSPSGILLAVFRIFIQEFTNDCLDAQKFLACSLDAIAVWHVTSFPQQNATLF